MPDSCLRFVSDYFQETRRRMSPVSSTLKGWRQRQDSPQRHSLVPSHSHKPMSGVTLATLQDHQPGQFRANSPITRKDAFINLESFQGYKQAQWPRHCRRIAVEWLVTDDSVAVPIRKNQNSQADTQAKTLCVTMRPWPIKKRHLLKGPFLTPRGLPGGRGKPVAFF